MPSRSPPRGPTASQRTDYSKLKQRAPRHIHWRTITTYTATYKAGKKGKGKQTLTVRTVNNLPPEEREFQLSGDTLKTFKRTDLKKQTRKAIIIMATKTKDKKSEKASTKSRKKPVDEEVDEELAGLEELSEDADSDSDDESTDDTDDADGDDDEEAVEEPKSKKGKKKKDKDKKKSRAKSNGKIGTQEIAAEAGCDARTLRMVLRKHKIEKDEETNRYEWDSLEAPAVKKILKLIKEGAAKEVKQEGLDKLKKKKEDEKAAEGKKGKKNKKDKKKKEQDDDE